MKPVQLQTDAELEWNQRDLLLVLECQHEKLVDVLAFGLRDSRVLEYIQELAAVRQELADRETKRMLRKQLKLAKDPLLLKQDGSRAFSVRWLSRWAATTDYDRARWYTAAFQLGWNKL